MTTLDANFVKMCTEARIPEEVMKFFVAQGILEASDLAVLASNENEVKSEIIDPILAVVTLTTLAQKGSIRKLWMACKKKGKVADKADMDTEAGLDGPIPPVPYGDLEKRWSMVHGFTMPDSWLLTANLTGKMWRAFTADKPFLEQMLAESLRLRVAPPKQSGSLISFEPGKTPQTHEIVADSIGKPIELYMRIRAWLNTMAFICINRVDFFDFPTAILASEKILNFCTQTFDSAHAPVSHYVKAWAATITFFAEHVKTAPKNTLKEAILMTASWEHRWTSYQPPSGGGGSSGYSGGPDLPKHVLDEMRQLKEAVVKWQGIADKANDVAEKEVRRNRASSQQQHNHQKGSGNKNFQKGKGGGGKGKNNNNNNNNMRKRSPSRRRDDRGRDQKPRR